jgi:hypothetical protein
MLRQDKGWGSIRLTTDSFHIPASSPFTFNIEFYAPVLCAVEVDIRRIKVTSGLQYPCVSLQDNRTAKPEFCREEWYACSNIGQHGCEEGNATPI